MSIFLELKEEEFSFRHSIKVFLAFESVYHRVQDSLPNALHEKTVNGHGLTFGKDRGVVLTP